MDKYNIFVRSCANFAQRGTYRKQWADFVNKKYGIDYSEHHVMVLEFMTKMANTLRTLDGNRYPSDYYMYLVWTGGLEYWWEGAFSEEIVKDWESKYNVVKSDPKKYKCD